MSGKRNVSVCRGHELANALLFLSGCSKLRVMTLLVVITTCKHLHTVVRWILRVQMGDELSGVEYQLLCTFLSSNITANMIESIETDKRFELTLVENELPFRSCYYSSMYSLLQYNAFFRMPISAKSIIRFFV